MGRVITLVVLAIGAWYAYHDGWPWLQGKLAQLDSAGRSSEAGFRGEDPEASACLDRAHHARDRVASEVRALGPPPVDARAWDRSVRTLDGALYDAESACRCGGEACRRADEALGELRAIVATFDDLVHGAAPADANPARRMERADGLLTSARAAAARGPG